MSDEVYRGVNKYIDFSTGKELLKKSRTYNDPSPAKAMATRMRCPYGKDKAPKAIKMALSGGIFEYDSTWVEYATVWEKIK